MQNHQSKECSNYKIEILQAEQHIHLAIVNLGVNGQKNQKNNKNIRNQPTMLFNEFNRNLLPPKNTINIVL